MVKYEIAKLYRCTPTEWLFLPKTIRTTLGWITITLFSTSFLVLPSCIFFVLPITWKHFSYGSTIFLSMIGISMILPLQEWQWMRKIGQLWYEIFDLHCNVAPDDLETVIDKGNDEQYIIAMHPHGIIPFQAVLWAAYCDQYFSSKKTGKFLYGFGAAADIVMYLPFLRNVMGWLSAGSATYSVLKAGLMKGESIPVNAVGRKPKHLFILPGGIAEVFTSKPQNDCIVFKDRRGLIKLSIETGAMLIPTYVFGGTDFFNNLATSSGFFSKLSRKLRMGITIFWGPYGLPIPYPAKVTLCLGDPIPPPKWDLNSGPIPKEMIEELHTKFLNEMIELFDKYKAEAGRPNAVLKVV